jgi:hypothetical protein
VLRLDSLSHLNVVPNLSIDEASTKSSRHTSHDSKLTVHSTFLHRNVLIQPDEVAHGVELAAASIVLGLLLKKENLLDREDDVKTREI